MIFKKFKDFLKKDGEASPQQNIKNWCQKYSLKKYTINEDLSVDINGDVYIQGCDLTQLPFQFGKVVGDFDCSNNNLTFLDGAPTEVGGAFTCASNLLTTLKNSPKIVDRSFNCGNNKLVDLQGAPQEVHGNFNCGNNPQLVSLNGISLIRGKFYCTGSPVEEIWELFKKDPKFLDVFESYNLFQVPGVIDSAVVEEIIQHLGQKLALKNYTVI